MLILGHAGITLGLAALSTVALTRRKSLSPKAKASDYSREHAPVSTAPHNPATGSRASWFSSLANYLDIRFLLLGSLLPDLIDKPIGIYLFRATFESGRIFCHTLLFTILLALIGFYLYQRSGKTWLLALSFGTFTHLVLDQMWLYPHTLLWPTLGFIFDKTYPENWLEDIFYGLMVEPVVFVSELVGAAILIWFALALLRRKKLLAFIKYGQA